MIVVISLCSLVLSLFLAGCSEQQHCETIEQIYKPDIDKAEAMQIAEDVLAKMHFTIDKADIDRGIIRTKPLPAAQFFEFWRSDNIGAFNCAEANLQSIRRIAQLDIKSQDDKIYIGCDVQVQRLSLPESHELNQAPSQLTLTTGAEWIDLGKDTQLATEILKRIENRFTAENAESAKRRKRE